MEPETYNWSQYAIPAVLLVKTGLMAYLAYSLRQVRKGEENFNEGLRSVNEHLVKEAGAISARSLELIALAENPERLRRFLEIGRREYATVSKQ